MRSAKPGNHLNSLSLILIIILIMMMTIMVMIVISCFYRRITTTTQFPPSSARIKMEDLDVDLFKLLVTVGFVFLTWVSQILCVSNEICRFYLLTSVSQATYTVSLSNCSLTITYIV